MKKDKSKSHRKIKDDEWNTKNERQTPKYVDFKRAILFSR